MQQNILQLFILTVRKCFIQEWIVVVHGYSNGFQYADILVKEVRSKYYQHLALNFSIRIFFNKNSNSNYGKIQHVCIYKYICIYISI